MPTRRESGSSRCLYPPAATCLCVRHARRQETVARYGSVLAGGKRVGRPRTRAPAAGHHFGQTAQKIELVTHHWSGKHQRVVRGINLQTLLWTDGKALIPCDFRVYHTPKTVRAKTTISRRCLRKRRKL
jgi:hypothetical protein